MQNPWTVHLEVSTISPNMILHVLAIHSSRWQSFRCTKLLINATQVILQNNFQVYNTTEPDLSGDEKIPTLKQWMSFRCKNKNFKQGCCRGSYVLYPWRKDNHTQTISRLCGRERERDLLKTSSSPISLPEEESQLRSYRSSSLLSSWDLPFAVSWEATLGAELLSSNFLWPKSQFGLLSCISLHKIKST